MKRLASYGGAAALVGAGFAGASVALAPAAAAQSEGCYDAYGCSIFLTDSNGYTGYGGSWGNNGQSGTCNVALYSGPNVVVGGAIAQGPKLNCNVFSDSQTGPKGSGNTGGVYTVAMWQNGNVIGSMDGTFPY
jgi:hypothetical protein